jgi:hypothetical protein
VVSDDSAASTKREEKARNKRVFISLQSSMTVLLMYTLVFLTF